MGRRKGKTTQPHPHQTSPHAPHTPAAANSSRLQQHSSTLLPHSNRVDPDAPSAPPPPPPQLPAPPLLSAPRPAALHHPPLPPFGLPARVAIRNTPSLDHTAETATHTHSLRLRSARSPGAHSPAPLVRVASGALAIDRQCPAPPAAARIFPLDDECKSSRIGADECEQQSPLVATVALDTPTAVRRSAAAPPALLEAPARPLGLSPCAPPLASHSTTR